MGEEALEELRRLLQLIPPGEIEFGDALLEALSRSWHLFEGGDAEEMSGSKLEGRVEYGTWKPPILRFTIERHGPTALGSIYGTLQMWTVDVDRAVADCRDLGRVQLYDRKPPLGVKPLADEIVELIRQGKDDPRLKWSPDRRRIRIFVGKIIPSDSAVKRTLEGQRKRFRKELAEGLREEGWQEAKYPTFERSQPGSVNTKSP